MTRPTYGVVQPLGWWGIFSATLAAMLVGGLLLLGCVRVYVHWSMSELGKELRSKDLQK